MKIKKFKKLKASQRRELIRIAEYLVSGGAFFWSGYVALILFRAGLGWSLWWATALSYLIGWTVNYILQRYWVFRHPRLKKHELEVTSRYLIISFVNLFINYAILWFLESIGITVYIGQFVSAGFFTVWNYLWYKHWVFYAPPPKRRPRKKAAAKKPRTTTRSAAKSRAGSARTKSGSRRRSRL